MLGELNIRSMRFNDATLIHFEWNFVRIPSVASVCWRRLSLSEKGIGQFLSELYCRKPDIRCVERNNTGKLSYRMLLSLTPSVCRTVYL
jgi:hypothetical protein